MGDADYIIPTESAQAVSWRLLETVAWCSYRLKVGGSLHTPELQPRRHLVVEHPNPDGRSKFEIPSTEQRRDEVAAVCERRSALLRNQRIEVGNAPPTAAEGSLLIVEIDYSMWDGLSEGESNGFLDAFDVPPWDTWIDLQRRKDVDTLLSWVPAPFIRKVERGIAVNAPNCIHWLDGLDIASP